MKENFDNGISDGPEGDKNKANTEKAVMFANQLLVSRSFVHFMDGYICDDIMNFDLVNSILCFRNELKRRYKAPSVTLKPFNELMKNKLQSLLPYELENLRKKYEEST